MITVEVHILKMVAPLVSHLVEAGSGPAGAEEKYVVSPETKRDIKHPWPI